MATDVGTNVGVLKFIPAVVIGSSPTPRNISVSEQPWPRNSTGKELWSRFSRGYDWAFVEIILLWAAILATLIVFWKRSRWAGGLLVPYLAWVSFASILNFTIWRLNV